MEGFSLLSSSRGSAFSLLLKPLLVLIAQRKRQPKSEELDRLCVFPWIRPMSAYMLLLVPTTHLRELVESRGLQPSRVLP